VEALRGNIEHYVKEKGLAPAPVTLNAEAVGTNYGPYEVPRIEPDGIHLETKNYRFSYFAPGAGNPSRFALSGRCQSYGQNCLRSYFLTMTALCMRPESRAKQQPMIRPLWNVKRPMLNAKMLSGRRRRKCQTQSRLMPANGKRGKLGTEVTLSVKF
jgi:hypothetical protein